jgi:5-methylthioribose kinase
MREAAPLDDRSLPDYLRGLGLLRGAASVVIEAAGDGNINWVRRVRTGERSWVVKQARPALERFPQYRASTIRIACEARWLEAVRPLDRDRVCPAVVAFDEAARTLVLEDLGDAPRLDAALAHPSFDARAPAARLAGFLGAVHAATADDASLVSRFPNGEMQRLHGDHVFVLPFRENDFPLAPPVRTRAKEIWRKGDIAAQAATAYRRYLEPRGALVHGDVQAGNVLLAPRGAVLLDAEIAHVGDPAFDLGMLFAHCWLPAAARGAPSDAEPAVTAAWEAYATADGSGPERRAEATRYAGIELLRRTLGAARMPAVEAPGASLAVIDFARTLLD